MVIRGKVEKITKEQFKVEKSSKGKAKIIKEVEHPSETKKRRQIRKIVSNIQEEENENSYF